MGGLLSCTFLSFLLFCSRGRGRKMIGRRRIGLDGGMAADCCLNRSAHFLRRHALHHVPHMREREQEEKTRGRRGDGKGERSREREGKGTREKGEGGGGEWGGEGQRKQGKEERKGKEDKRENKTERENIECIH